MSTYLCRATDHYPHGEDEPIEPWAGPQKSIDRTTLAEKSQKMFGDFFRHPREATKKKLQKFVEENPDIKLPEFARRKLQLEYVPTNEELIEENKRLKRELEKR
jgi:hypothetical protein